MTQRKTSKANSACGSTACDCSPGGGCRVEAVISVDERGQMVLPKDVREKAGIQTGDKLALVSWERDGVICCIALLKAENLSALVKDMLGPLMGALREE